MRKPSSRVGSRGRPLTAGVRRRTACRRRGAPPFVASAWLPVSVPAILLLGPLLVLLAGGCSAGILGDDPETGLELEVVRGPIDPVVREGEEGENTAPVEGAVVRVRRSGGGKTRTTTDAAGRARLALEPGRYTVEVEECPGALTPPSPAAVTVEAGRLATVRLECDTGIR